MTSTPMTSAATPGALPIDHHARAMALDPTRSFAVTAPAGSGKTGLLTQRVLRLLASCEHPEEVLCITFTRKAAAEMQERVSAAIRRGASAERPDDPHLQLSWELARAVLQRDRDLGWNLLENPNRLRIQTIDGLCGALTRQNPLSSQSGGMAALLEHPDTAYRQAVAATLISLESDAPVAQDIERLLSHLDNNAEAVTALLMRLLSRRDQWMGHLLQARQARPYLESVLAELVSDSLGAVRRILATHGGDLIVLADYAGSQLQATAPDTALARLAGLVSLPAPHSDDLPQWQALTELLLTQSDSWRSPKGLNVNIGFPPGHSKDEKALCKARKDAMARLLGELSAIPGLLSQLVQIRHLPPATYARDQWRLLDSLTHILPRLVAELKLVFRQLNATDFIEITQSALAAFGDEDSPSELALALDYRIRHILVDEFQDTSSPQLRLLENLTRGWQPGDGRTLFIVGDGMQSCYGFRDANVGIFLDARRRGIGDVVLEPLDLQVNFRSQQGIIDWVNQTFVSAFPETDDISRGAVSYSAAAAFHPPRPGSATELHLFVDAPDRTAEAERVCALIRAARAADTETTIAILVRNRGMLRAIIPALQQAGIRWQATDIDPLASRMAIIDLLTLTRALLDPSDRIAWLALLRSPWCGLDLHDLQNLAGLHCTAEDAHFPVLLEQILTGVSELSTPGQQIFRRFAAVIRQVWQQRRRKTLRQWIEGAWLTLGGPACLLDDADYANCNTFFSLLDKADNGGQIGSWEEFTASVEKLYAAPDPGGDPHLQIMTIHKSKGLEFDTVIIPGLDVAGRSDDNELLLWQERIAANGHKQLLLSTLAPTGQDTDPVYHYLKEEKKLRNKLESTRLIYVGCTRAINKLHLLANVKSDSKAENLLKAPPRGSLLAGLWPGLDLAQALLTTCGTDAAADSSSDDDEPAVSAFPYSLRLSAAWQAPVMVPPTLLAAYRGREFADEENLPDIENFAHRYQRQTGTVLHRVLEQIARSGPASWNNDKLRQQLPYWQTLLRQAGLFGQDLSQAQATLELAVRKMLSDPIGLWLLDAGHRHSACELELHHGSDNHSIAIIDRTFIDGDTRWIIDYKSSIPAAGQTTEQFLVQETAAYTPQLQRYARLFRLQGETDIRAALYFPLLQQLQEIPV